MYGQNGWADAAHDETGDDALVAQSRRDPAAFGLLYDRYLGPVYRYCHHRLGERVAAEDATSAVFTRALAALPRYEPGNFRAWLFTIAHNTVVDARRHRRPTHPLAEADATPDPAPLPDEAALADEERDSLFALLARLPLEQRRVMELRLSGLPTPEVAAIVGRSPGAVRSLQFRAVGRLREMLEAAPREETHAGR